MATTTTTTTSTVVGMKTNSSVSTTPFFQKIQYRLLGPTTVHIEYECYLLICMILLVVATIRGLYKESSFTSVFWSTNRNSRRSTTTDDSYYYVDGDYVFVVLVCLVLSRHVLIRIYCTFDPSTHVTSNIFGAISHGIQSTIFASSGHCFDRAPPPIQISILQSYHNTTSSSSSSGTTSYSGGFGLCERTVQGGTTGSGGGGALSTPFGSHNSTGLSATSLSSPTTTPTAIDRMIHITGGMLDMNTREATKSTFTLSLSQIVPSSLIYALQIPRKLFWFPLTRIVGTPQIHLLSFISYNDNDYFHSSSNTSGESRRMRNSGSNSNHHHNKFSNNSTSIVQWIVRTLVWVQQSIYHILFVYGPSLRFLLSTRVGLEVFWQLFFVWADGHTVVDDVTFSMSGIFELLSYFSGDGTTTTSTYGRRSMTTKQNLYIHTHDVKKMLQIAEQESAAMVGHYVHQLKPSVLGSLWILVGFGTIYCLVFFTRIAFPLPDLLSSVQMGKDTNYARTNTTGGANSTTTTSTSSGKKGHHHHHHHQSNNTTNTRRPSNSGWLSKSYSRFTEFFSSIIHNKKSTNARTIFDAFAWIQRQYTAISTNRLYASAFVLFGRVTENIIIVGILPRTQFACRVMGHCSSGLSLSEMSRVLYPGGLNTPMRTDGDDASESMERDLFSAIWALVAVFTISTVLLLTQTLVLNRSYLSTRAYHSLEWELVSKDTKKHQRQSDYADVPWIASSHHQSSSDVWDGRRKYVRGEEVYYPDWFGVLYRARVNSPEGHPNANTFPALDEELLSELGHPATSRIIASLASIQFFFACCFSLMWIVCVLRGAHSYTHGLIWAMLSCSVAVHGVLATTRRASYTTISKNGNRQMSRAMQALQKLNGEIMKHNC